jgi:methylated-DNA-[protein]-cysteine S-methyltransferase
MTRAATATIDTVAGPFTIVVANDVVIASGWTTSLAKVLEPVSMNLRPQTVETRRELGAVTDAVRRYSNGELTAIDDIEVEQHSGPFIEAAWDLLRAVPAGAAITYAEFAAKAGRPDAVRAAASACARNAAALFVPCHRVVRTGGGLGGFRWGLEVKRQLLDHEAARPS